jgi:glycerophosphoryl diester phosphodiesterase
MKFLKMKPVFRILFAVLLVLYSISLLRKPVDDTEFFRTLPDDRPLVIAHRGGALLFPENTLTAFHKAMELGSDILELDIWLTADGIPVVLHDGTIDRTTDGSGHVNEFTLMELQSFDAGYRFTPLDTPDEFPYRGQGMHIPALREVFKAFPDTHVIVEVKEERPEAAETLVQLVQEFDRVFLTMGASFHHSILRYFRDNLPEMITHASEQEIIPFLILSQLRLEGLITPKYQSFNIPTKQGRILVANRSLIRAAERRNLFVGIWTINEPDDMIKLIERGAHGIITDRPDYTLDIIASQFP